MIGKHPLNIGYIFGYWSLFGKHRFCKNIHIRYKSKSLCNFYVVGKIFTPTGNKLMADNDDRKICTKCLEIYYSKIKYPKLRLGI